mmetsp:Transcript_4055/g.15251  ORF Transcript_4055/g.15251 Transcript_4055/m.15251 type:complete len:218 (+) Transcript_4055:4005-4658(+)
MQQQPLHNKTLTHLDFPPRENWLLMRTRMMILLLLCLRVTKRNRNNTTIPLQMHLVTPQCKTISTFSLMSQNLRAVPHRERPRTSQQRLRLKTTSKRQLFSQTMLRNTNLLIQRTRQVCSLPPKTTKSSNSLTMRRSHLYWKILVMMLCSTNHPRTPHHSHSLPRMHQLFWSTLTLSNRTLSTRSNTRTTHSTLQFLLILSLPPQPQRLQPGSPLPS